MLISRIMHGGPCCDDENENNSDHGIAVDRTCGDENEKKTSNAKSSFLKKVFDGVVLPLWTCLHTDAHKQYSALLLWW
jgi:hypothetical protein